MSNSTLIAGPLNKMGRAELARIPVPPATPTHKPVPHHEIVGALIETLGFRHIGVVEEEYAVSNEGMKMFGVLDLETQMEGCRFSIGLRNSHDKSFRLALTVGYRVFVCSNMSFSGDFTPVLAKHSKSFNLIDTLAVGVDRIQRNFEPMQRQVEQWRSSQISVSWRHPEVFSRKCIACTSSRNIPTSRREPCGAYRTHLPARSRGLIPFHSSRRPRN